MRISGRRILVACVIGCAVATLAVALWGALATDGAREPLARAAATEPAVGPVPPAGSVQEPRSRTVAALAVLRHWDRARARAWAQGDLRSLRGLYVDGSAAGRRDGAMLRRWTERGLRVRGMSMQVLGVRLRVATRDRLVLVVRDRLVGAYAVDRGRRIPLPRDNASTRRLEFRRVEGRWLLRSVS